MKTDSLARTRTRPNRAGWRIQLTEAFRDPSELLAHLSLSAHAPVESRFPMMVPRAFAARMVPGDPDDPLLRQVLPDRTESEARPGFTDDPVGDLASVEDRGVLHKYRGRALLIATGACAVHCRYCFRQAFPYASEQAASRQWSQAVDYIARRADIEEVILSGGDPLMLSTERLRELTDRLAGIGHVRRLRIHTRLPIVLPDRVTDNLCRWLSELPWSVVIVVHANHAAEFDATVDEALERLRARGVHLLNQAVLLAGVNDDAGALAALMRRGFEAGALPYYLHLLDPVSGAARFDGDEAHARRLVDHLRRELSGYLVPRLVREQAGAPYKLPVL
jgi:EF-P beta-lysylation protein EpmB